MTFLAIIGAFFLLGLWMVLRSPILRLLVATLAPMVVARVLSSRGTAQGSAKRPQGAMREEEAREILGVSQTASRNDILEAHRRLMKQMHPDHGGSHYFAARINQARDVLLDAGVIIDNDPQ